MPFNLFRPPHEVNFRRELRKLLGYKPRKLKLYKQAFTHKSAGEGRFSHPDLSNERLEFLGDAVLSLVIGDYIYEKFPGKDEGFLSQLRSKASNRDFFNALGTRLNLPKLLKHPYTSGTSVEVVPSMIGNAFEALFGAIFLDKGYKQAEKFFLHLIKKEHLDIEEVHASDTNYKSRLLEWAQKKGKRVEFRLINTERMKGNVIFTIEVTLDGKHMGTGRNAKKKKAEQEASEEALEKLKIRN